MNTDNTRKYCDLHTHSLFSDGTYTPTELIEEADALGLSAVALCDHNTTRGLTEFLAAAEHSEVEAIAGTELSTHWRTKELHIVGLFIPPEHFEGIDTLVGDIWEKKERSYRELIASLSRAGYELDYDEIARRGDGGHINRAHIAEELFRLGYVPTIKDAFTSLLSRGGGHYREPEYISSLEAIAYLKSIGAVTVLAHPYLSLSPEEVREFLPEAKAAGLDAMETVYTKYSEGTMELAKNTAVEFGLLESGGSDFHGDRKPDTFLGVGRGNILVPSDFVRRLKTAL